MAKGNQTGGRAKGIPVVIASDLRRMILGALDDAGGHEYLARQAEKTPSAFLALVGVIMTVVQYGRLGRLARALGDSPLALNTTGTTVTVTLPIPAQRAVDSRSEAPAS